MTTPAPPGKYLSIITQINCNKVIIFKMTQNSYFIKVLSGKGKSKNIYRIQTIWDNANNNFTITILDGNKAYETKVNTTILNEQAINYEIDFKEYINTIQLCLSPNNLENFLYNIENNEFLISRPEQGYHRKIANFNLHKIDFNVACVNFIDELIKCNENFQNQISINKEDKNIAINEKNTYLDKLQHYVKEKEKMENELYSKFILLLNEKKLRIQYLTDIITKHKESINNDDMEEQIQKKINELKNKETISESSDSEDEKISEEIVHKAQIELPPKEPDFLDYDTEEIPLPAIPKRNKSSQINETNNKQMKNSTKNSSQINLEDINDCDTQEFNTQALNDLL